LDVSPWNPFILLLFDQVRMVRPPRPLGALAARESDRVRCDDRGHVGKLGTPRTAHECCASDLLLRVVSKLVGQRETFAGVSTPPRVNVAATASRTVSPSNIRDSAKKGAPGALEVVDAMSKAAPAVVVVLRPEDEARLKASSENVRSELSPGCWRRIPSADRTRNRSSSTRVTGMPTM